MLAPPAFRQAFPSMAEKYHWTKELPNTVSLLNGLGSQAKPIETKEKDIYQLLDIVISD
ncbi:hypothetical protein DPMN_107059 [Dreissena polymorpha]|uniref:Uncharacterized protein n=1 Tax=Dreissena polymorpha TaxID=45954 RepID=A0A9D4QJD7_DREPO|nr:hypothetical protein DPMN_107059 [Dreissena polymorpha]